MIETAWYSVMPTRYPCFSINLTIYIWIAARLNNITLSGHTFTGVGNQINHNMQIDEVYVFMERIKILLEANVENGIRQCMQL